MPAGRAAAGLDAARLSESSRSRSPCPIVTGLVFGLAPALQSTTAELAPTLKAESGAVAGRASRGCARPWWPRRWRCRCCCSIGAGLFIRTLHNLTRVDLGLQARRSSFAFDVDPSRSGYTSDQTKQFARALLERLRLGAWRGVGRAGDDADSPGRPVEQLVHHRRPRAGSRRQLEHAVQFGEPRLLHDARHARWSPAATSKCRDAYVGDPGEDAGFRVAIVNEAFVQQVLPEAATPSGGTSASAPIRARRRPSRSSASSATRSTPASAPRSGVRCSSRITSSATPAASRSTSARARIAETAMTLARRTVQQLDANLPVSELRAVERRSTSR